MPSGWEIPAIIFIVLLLFGAKKLPELARGLGRSMGEFKKAKNEFDREIRDAAEITEVDTTSRPEKIHRPVDAEPQEIKPEPAAETQPRSK